LRLISKSYDRTRKVPARLAAEIARVTSVAQGKWAEARKTEDLAGFLPVLGQVVALRQEEGAALAAGGDAYDALLDGYEPDLTGDEIASLFKAMRPRIVALRERVMAAPPAPELTGHFPKSAQLALSAEIAQAFGYDLARGRIDEAVHPFSSGLFQRCPHHHAGG
jgi:carboxypeptidase Taq